LTTIFTFDTCGCIIEYTVNGKWRGTVKKCRLHERLKKQTLLDTVIAQNRRFNLSMDITRQENATIVELSKRVNFLRIQVEDLTNFQEELPKERSISRLKRILRL